MRRFGHVIGVLALLLTLGVGVILARGIHIDEDVVFMPILRPDRAVLSLQGEAALGAEVRHERVDMGGESIALTMVGPDSGPLIVSCFGNATDRIEHGADYAAKITPHGQALLWDYPGYGDSSGMASVDTLGLVLDDLAPLITQKSGARPLVLWGHSLGGFVCANLALRLPSVDALVLETTAPSVRAVAKAWTPDGLPLRVSYDEGLLRFDIPTALAEVDAPVLIIGAGRDRVLPITLSQELAQALPDATYLELPEATHFSAGFDPRAQAAVAELLTAISPD